MSQIDEAFIQAYAPHQQPPSAPGVGEVPVVSPHPPLAGLHAGPHFQQPIATQPPTTQPPAAMPSAAWTPEPIPAPHFQVPSDYQAAPVAVPNQTAEAVAPVGGVVGGAGERRPLSTFSVPQPPATTAFNPAYEVDGFRWPKITDDLLTVHHRLFAPVAEQLVRDSEQGRSLVGFAGTRPNIGCATVLMCLARLIAGMGKSVALVDANFAKASLARDLGLKFNTGWENVLTGELPLAECVVKSVQDRMALLPLVHQTAAANELLASIHTSVTAGVLRYHYDVVLFNLGAAGQPPQHAAAHSVLQHCRLDANIIVANSNATGTDTALIDPLMSLFGQTCLGVIGNNLT